MCQALNVFFGTKQKWSLSPATLDKYTARCLSVFTNWLLNYDYPYPYYP